MPKQQPTALADAISKQTIQAARRAAIEELEESYPCMMDNGMEFPEQLSKFFAVEFNSGESIWGLFADTLDEIALLIEQSDTQCDSVRVHDLDTRAEYLPIRYVLAFYNTADDTRIEVKR